MNGKQTGKPSHYRAQWFGSWYLELEILIFALFEYSFPKGSNT